MEVLDLSDWEYRNEGNAALVVAHKTENKVLRLRKRDRTPISQVNHVQKEKIYKDAVNALDYMEFIMKPVLGSAFIHMGELVQLNKEFLQEIKVRVKTCRPKKRLITEVDENLLYALQMPDFCRLQPPMPSNRNPTFAIEIKPKLGLLSWVPNSVSDQMKDSVCRYCVIQHHKVAVGEWKHISKFCPIDLYSGDQSRMVYAINALVENPQNNLLIFKDGKVIFDGKNHDVGELEVSLLPYFGATSQFQSNGSINALVSIIQRILVAASNSKYLKCDSNPLPQSNRVTSDNNTIGSNNGMKHRTEYRCCQSGFKTQHDSQNYLSHGSVLYNLIQAQKLNSLNVESVHHLYQRIQTEIDTNPDQLDLLKIDGPYNSSEWRSIINRDRGEGQNSTCTDETSSKEVEEACRKVFQFLVATTAKDTSIMIALQPVDELGTLAPTHREVYNSTTGRRYMFSISLVDLDPKPFIRIPKYFKRETEVVKLYLKNTHES